MKRNMERSSGSSDEDKTSLKKAKKENSGKLKNAETEIGESIDGSKKRVTNCKVEEPLLRVKRGCTENTGDQKTATNKIGCNVNHKNDSSEKETGNINEDIITEIKVVSKETFTNRKYKKYQNSCNSETKLENILEESVSNCNPETTDEDGSRREETIIKDEEYALLAEQLTVLFREIYRDAMARNGEENSISKCQIRSKTLDSVIKISNAKGESYLCNFRTNSKENCNMAEKSDGGLRKETENYSSDNEVRNERLNESNNLSFGEDATNSKSFRDISSEKCDSVREESNSSWNSEIIDEGLEKSSSNTYDEYGVQSGQGNKNRKRNGKAIEKTKFTECLSNANSNEEYSAKETSDEVSDSSTDVKMSDEEGKYSSGDAEYDRRCSELINAEKKRMKCKVENGRSYYEGDRSELNGESDMSTDEDSWSDDTNTAEENDLGTEESNNDSTDENSNEETDSLGTEESDNSSAEESDDNNTDQSSDEVSSSYGEENSETSSGEDDSTDSETSSGEDDSTDSETSSGEEDSTDSETSSGEEDSTNSLSSIEERDMNTEDSSNESENVNNSDVVDENPEEDGNTGYSEDIKRFREDSERKDIRSVSNGKSSKIKDITDDESNNSACEELNSSTDTEAYYRSARKVNVASGDVRPSTAYGEAYTLFNYRSKEIIHSSTEDEDCLEWPKDCSSSGTKQYFNDAENIKSKRTPETVSEVNDESNSEESRSSDDTCGLESLFDCVLGFASLSRFDITTPGEDNIRISLTRFKLMPFKDYLRESVEGRYKKRIAANRKGNIITPPVKGNLRGEKRGRRMIQNKVSDKNKAAEVSEAEEQTSDEEWQVKDRKWQVKDRTSRKSRNKRGNKQIENDSNHKEDSESGEDYEEDDENSSEGAGEDNGRRHGDEDEEDIGEEESDEDYEEEADNESDDDECEEEEDEYVEEEDEDSEDVEEEEKNEDSEDVEEEEKNEDEEEENEEDVDQNVTAQMQNDDSSEQSSDNDQWNKLAKSRAMIKKNTAKQARGKTNLVKKKKDRGE